VIKLPRKKKDGGMPEFTSGNYLHPKGKLYYRCTLGNQKKVHWHLKKNNDGTMYGDPREYETLCGIRGVREVWGRRNWKSIRNKHVCQPCEVALKLVREEEQKDLDENYLYDETTGKMVLKPKAPPQESAKKIKARAQARPKKPWQPKNKQRSAKVAKKHAATPRERELPEEERVLSDPHPSDCLCGGTGESQVPDPSDSKNFYLVEPCPAFDVPGRFRCPKRGGARDTARVPGASRGARRMQVRPLHGRNQKGGPDGTAHSRPRVLRRRSQID
jgi:hypothetical protein